MPIKIICGGTAGRVLPPNHDLLLARAHSHATTPPPSSWKWASPTGWLGQNTHAEWAACRSTMDIRPRPENQRETRTPTKASNSQGSTRSPEITGSLCRRFHTIHGHVNSWCRRSSFFALGTVGQDVGMTDPRSQLVSCLAPGFYHCVTGQSERARRLCSKQPIWASAG